MFCSLKATLDANEESSELLPDKWNENSDSYALRYVQDGRVCVLLATVKNDTALLNFLVRSGVVTKHSNAQHILFQVGSSLQVSNIALKTTETVKALRGPLKTLVPDIESVISRLKKELIEPITQKIVASTSTESETQTHPTRIERDVDPLRVRGPSYGRPAAPDFE